MTKMKLVSALLFMTVGLASNVFAQNVDLNLRYNIAQSRYEVYARPDATNPTFSWGPSQITVVVPSSVDNNAFVATSANGGTWTDNSQIYAPGADPTSDFHAFGSTGSSVVLTAGVELLLFHFTIPGGCVDGLRIFDDGNDPSSSAAGMGGGDFRNSIFAGLEAYQSNYTVDAPTVDASPGTAAICAGSSYTADASVSTGSILWTTNGDGSFMDATIEDAIYMPGMNDINNGTVTLTITSTVNSASCDGTSASDNIVLTIGAAPTADAGLASADICAGSTYTAAGTATGGTIAWSTPAGNAGFSNPTIANPVYTPTAADITAGTVTLTMMVTGTNTGCVGTTVSDNIVLTIGAAPTADAGVVSVDICAGSTYTSTGAAATGGTIAWSTPAGNAGFSDAAIANPVYTPTAADITAGTVTLTMTVTGTNAGCGSTTVSDNIVLMIGEAPTANAGPASVDICAGSTYTSTGAAATGGTIAWSTPAGSAGFSDATIANPVYTPTAADITAGTVTLTMTVTGTNAGCGSTTVSDNIVLMIGEAPTADAGPANADICAGSAYTSTGAAATGGTIAWSTPAGSAGFSDATIANPVYTPTAADITAGTVTLTMTVTGTNAGCGSTIVNDNIVLTIGAAPTADAGVATANICEGSTYTASATASGGDILWTAPDGDGSFTDANIEDAEYTPGAQDLIDGTVTLRMTVTGTNAGCGSTTVSDDIALTIGAAPTADAGPASADICAGSTYTLTGAAATGGTITWSTPAGNAGFSNPMIANPVYTPTAADITAGTVTLTMTVTNTNPGCGTIMVSDAIVLNINPLPTTPAITGISNPLCLDETLTVSTIAVGTVTWNSSDETVATIDENTGEITPLTVGTTDITYTVSDGTCSATSAAIQLTTTDIGCTASLEVKVLLQGALIGTSDGLMRDDLRTGTYIPLTEPYNSSGIPKFAAFGNGGGETTTAGVLNTNTVPSNAIVDWVLIELRDAADQTNIVETIAALLQRDGDVVDPSDGVSPVKIAGESGTSYYVAVKHRNHLGVMTANPQVLTLSGTTVDFITATPAEVYDTPGGIDYNGSEMIQISGSNALWAGNANADNKIKYQGRDTDVGIILTEVLNFPGNTGNAYNYNSAFGYFPTDVNMDGQVKYQGPVSDPSFVFANVLTNYVSINTSMLYNFDLLIEQIPVVINP